MEPERAGRRAAALLVAVVVAATLAALTLPTQPATSLTFDTIGLAAVIAMVLAIRRAKLPDARGWWLLAGGPILFIAGDLVWDFGLYVVDLPDTVYEITPNVLYLLGYPFIALGLVQLARSRTGQGDKAAIADGLIVACAGAIPVWEFLIAPAVNEMSGSTFDNAAAIAYPLLDLVVLGALVRIAVTAERRTASLWYLVAGISLILAADTYYLTVTLDGGSSPLWLDVAWPVSYALLAAAAMHPSMQQVARETTSPRAILSRSRIVLVTSALFVAPLTLLIADDYGAQELDPFVFGPVAALVVGLVLWRVLMLVGDAERTHVAVEENERRFRSLVQHAADVIMVVGPDARVRYVSPAVTTVLGGAAPDYLGRPLAALVHPDDLDAAAGILVDALARLGADHTFEARFERAGGGWRHLEARVTSYLDDPAVGGMVANLRDVTDRKVADELRAAENRILELIARGARLEDTLGELVETVESSITGASLSIRVLEAADDAVGLRIAPHVSTAFVHLADELLLADEMPAAVAIEHLREPLIVEDALEDERFAVLNQRLPADSYRAGWVFPIRSADDERALGVMSCFFETPRSPTLPELEVTSRAVHTAAIAIERSSVHDRLMHLALHDALTGLPNRSLVLDRLTQALRRRQRADRSVGVLFLDIDRFKLVNDSLGHDAGDELIVAVAARLVGAMRPGDTVARFGGDEFVIVCEGLESPMEAEVIAARIADGLAQPFALPRGETIVTASIGIALARDASATATGLLRDADAAMYRAKERGRARHEVFDDEMHTRALLRLRTEHALRGALEHDQLRVAYQPQFDLRSRAVAGAEALVRWQHPERGLVTPGEFVPIAEETGLIVPIGEWVLEHACEAGAQRDLAVSVNLSGRQVVDNTLVASVERVLAESGVAPERLCLEVTESVLLDDEHATLAVLRELEAIGVRLSIDDFGTGYSALAYLERFPFDELKVDQTFVAGLGQAGGSEPIVGATIEMAHSLGMVVVAEGVETAIQLAHLRRLGCDRAQGFLLARPMALEQLDRFLGAAPARAS